MVNKTAQKIRHMAKRNHLQALYKKPVFKLGYHLARSGIL